MHSLASCPVPTPAQVDLRALGDFPTSNDTTLTLPLTAQNVRLGFPSSTLALQATARPDSYDQAFIGSSERGSSGLDFLLWPEGSACELFRATSYPANLGGEALGYASSNGLLMIAGSEGFSSSAVVGAMTFDARTGQSATVDPRDAMRVPRSFATVSAFGDQLLVAGGEYPIHESGTAASVFNDTGEVYDPLTSSFEAEFVQLAQGVAHHAAVPLASGEIALIGGQTAVSGASNFIQILSPQKRTAKLLGTLSVGRHAPSVLRLDDDRLFVAGGEDASGNPIGAIEWRGADAAPLPEPFDGSLALPPRFDRAYATLPGGAVLAVGGCQDRAPESGEDCARACERGCPPGPANSPRYEAFWISSDGAVTELNLSLSAGHPRLLAGSDGSPWLVTENDELFRFDPWHAEFQATGIRLEPSGTQTPARFVAMGSDSFAWLTDDARGVVLQGMRLGTRSTFSNDVPLVSLRDANDPSRPAHLVPDRPPSTELSYEGGGPGALVFAASAGGASKPCVWISDARFADFSAEIAFTSDVTPSLRVGNRELVDPRASNAQSACALPAASSGGDVGRVLLERAGNHLALTIGSERSECSLEDGRVPLAVCASELGPVRVTRVAVKRRE